MIRCIPVASCAACPYFERHYGEYECRKLNFQRLPKLTVSNGQAAAPPDWCPLPPHPSFSQPTGAAEGGA